VRNVLIGGNIKKATYTALIQEKFWHYNTPTSFVGKHLNQGCLRQVLR